MAGGKLTFTSTQVWLEGWHIANAQLFLHVVKVLLYTYMKPNHQKTESKTAFPCSLLLSLSLSWK